LQIVDLNNFSTIASPKDLYKVNFQEAVVASSKNTTTTDRHFGLKKLRQQHKFHQFYAWKHIHYYTGNPHVPRTHAHLCPLHAGPTASYYKRKNTPNYLAITEEEILLEKEEIKEEFKKVVKSIKPAL
jgi:hypothetical protein